MVKKKMGVRHSKWGSCVFFELLQKSASTWRLELLLVHDWLILEKAGDVLKPLQKHLCLHWLETVTKVSRSFFYGKFEEES